MSAWKVESRYTPPASTKDKGSTMTLRVGPLAGAMILAVALLTSACHEDERARAVPSEPPQGADVCRASSTPTAEKWKAIDRSAQHLVAALTSRREPPQILMLAETTGNPAVFDPELNEIRVEERVFDICASFGERSNDCLAFVLGHELAHFELRHLDASGIASKGGASLGKELHANAVAESHADQFSAMFGHMAGYDSIGIGRETIERIYTCYGLAQKQDGYLPLAERKEVVESALEKARRLTTVFEAAGHLLVREHPADARRLYDWVAREFPAPEVRNNAALARLMETDVPTWGYSLPWYMNSKSRLETVLLDPAILANQPIRDEARAAPPAAYGSTPSAEQRRARLSTEARSTLRELTQSDNPPMGAVHNSILLLLSELRLNEAEQMLKGQEARFIQGHRLDYLLMLGVLHTLRDEFDVARTVFAQTGTLRPGLHEANLVWLARREATHGAVERAASVVRSGAFPAATKTESEVAK